MANENSKLDQGNNSREIFIGDWCFNPDHCVLRRGDKSVVLRPKDSDLLVYLAGHAGEVISLDDIITHVWHGIIVSEDSVYHAISQLRKAFAEEEDSTEYIHTISKKGYSLIAPVSRTVDKPPALPQSFKSLKIILVAIIVIIGGMFYMSKFFINDTVDVTRTIAALDRSIAVLPFADMSPDGDQEWFSDGLTDELLNSLTMLPELKVTGRTSAFRFKGQNIAISDIAKQLGVVHVVEGSVRRAGDTFRITAQLIRADDGFHLWSQTYDRPTDEIFEVQRDVAENIARSLDVVLDDERREEMFSTGTTNLEAFEAYQKAEELRNTLHINPAGEKSLWDVNLLYDQALIADPNFTSALMRKRDAYSHFLSGDYHWAPDRGDLTKQVAIKAVDDIYEQSIKLENSDKRKTLYQFYQIFNSDNWSTLPPLLEKIKQDPNYYNSTIIIKILIALGELDAMEPMVQKQYDRNPLNILNWYYLLGYHLSQRNCPVILQIVQKGERIFDQKELYWYLLMCQYLSNDQQALMAWNSEDFNIDKLTTPQSLITPSFILAINGEHEKLEEQIKPLADYGLFAAWMMQVYKIMDDQDAVNEAALRVDNNMINTQNFMASAIFSTGGTLPFQMQYAPNYVRKLRQAGLTEEKIRSMFMEDD